MKVGKIVQFRKVWGQFFKKCIKIGRKNLRRQERSNHGPSDYHSGALPSELKVTYNFTTKILQFKPDIFFKSKMIP